ncbi:hypothetical protein VIAQ111709_05310 [Vibrio aquimaris]|uniref:Uncharacterized protein n=1 Tax=Vibrio aquimaris TaxID=2587862 RepID=A0A5P9CGP3_9VIBR|nr:hypothetical protein FIV01_03400 [Vibrio aquimaris]
MKKIIALGLLFASSSVSANYFPCIGKVKNVYVYAVGHVNVETSYRNAPTQI